MHYLYSQMYINMINYCQQQTISHVYNLLNFLKDLQVLKKQASRDCKQNTTNQAQYLQQQSYTALRQKVIISSKSSPPIIYYQMKELIFCEKLFVQHQINHKYLFSAYQDIIFAEIIIKDLSCLSCDIKDSEIRQQVDQQFQRAAHFYSLSNKFDAEKSIHIFQSIQEKLGQNVGVLNNLALAYFKFHDLTKAKQKFEKSIILSPSSYFLYLNYATILFIIDRSRNNLDFIIETLTKSLSIEPHQFESHHNLGCVYKYRKEYQRSIQQFGFSIKINPDNHLSLNTLASLYKQVDKNELALNTILKSLKIKQGNHLAMICLGNILLKLFTWGQNVKLQKGLQITLQLYTNQKDYFSMSQYKKLKSIFKIYDRCYKQGHQSIQVFNGLGNICLLQKKYYRAITYFTKIINQYNKHMLGYYGVALSYYYLKQFNESLSKYQQALFRSQDKSLSIVIGHIFCILKSQTKSNIITKLYSTLQMLKNSCEMVCYFKAYSLEGTHKKEMINKGLSQSSNRNQSYKILADIMFQLEDYATALQYFTLLQEINSFPNVDYFVGRCYQQQGDRISAVNYYIKQLKSYPSDEHTLYRIAQIYYSFNFTNQNYQILYSLAKSILQINSQSIKAILFYSKLQMDQIHHKNRLLLLKNLFMLNEYSADSYNSLALAYLFNNQKYECLKFLTNGMKKDPKNSLILQNLACIQLLMGKKQTAAQYFIKSLACSDTNFAVYINYQGEINKHHNYQEQKAIKLFYYSLRMISIGNNQQSFRYFLKVLGKKQQIVIQQINNYISTLNFMKLKYHSSSNFLQLFKYLLIRTFYNKIQSEIAFNILIIKDQTTDYNFRLKRFNQNIIEEVTDDQLRKDLFFIILQQIFQIDEQTAMRTNEYFCLLSPSFCNSINRIKLINAYKSQSLVPHKPLEHISQRQSNKRFNKQINFLKKQCQKVYHRYNQSSKELIQLSIKLKILQRQQFQNQREQGYQPFNRYQKKLMKSFSILTMNILNMNRTQLNNYLKKLLDGGFMEILMNLLFFIISVIIKKQLYNNDFWIFFYDNFKEFLNVIKEYQGEYELQIKLWTIYSDILVGNKIVIYLETFQSFEGNHQLFQNITRYLKDSCYNIRYDQLILRYLTSEQVILTNKLTQNHRRVMNLFIYNFQSTRMQTQEWCYTTIFHFARIINGDNPQQKVKQNLQSDQQLLKYLNNRSIPNSFINKTNHIFQLLKKRHKFKLYFHFCMVWFNKYIYQRSSQPRFSILNHKNASYIEDINRQKEIKCFIYDHKCLIAHFGYHQYSIKRSNHLSENIQNYYDKIVRQTAIFKNNLANQSVLDERHLVLIKQQIFESIQSITLNDILSKKEFIATIKHKLSQKIKMVRTKQLQSSKQLLINTVQNYLLFIFIKNCLFLVQIPTINKSIDQDNHFSQIYYEIKRYCDIVLGNSKNGLIVKGLYFNKNDSQYTYKKIQERIFEEDNKQVSNILLQKTQSSNFRLINEPIYEVMQQQFQVFLEQTSYSNGDQVADQQLDRKLIQSYLQANQLSPSSYQEIQTVWQLFAKNIDAQTQQAIYNRSKINTYTFILQLYILINKLDKQHIYSSQIKLNRLIKTPGNFYFSPLENIKRYYSKVNQQNLRQFQQYFTTLSLQMKKYAISYMFNKEGVQVQQKIWMKYDHQQTINQEQIITMLNDYGSELHKIQVNYILQRMLKYHQSNELTIFNKKQTQQILSLTKYNIQEIFNILQQRIQQELNR